MAKRRCMSCGCRLRFAGMAGFYGVFRTRTYRCNACGAREWVMCRSVSAAVKEDYWRAVQRVSNAASADAYTIGDGTADRDGDHAG